MKLRVQRVPCDTCIFRKESPLDLKALLDAVRDFSVPGFLYFKGHRICHHSTDAVCSTFWTKFRDKFTLGQIAQRLGVVEYVDDDNQKGEATVSNKHQVKRAKRQRRAYTQNLLESAHRALRGEAPPQYPSNDEMLRVIRERRPALMAAVDAANARGVWTDRDIETLTGKRPLYRQPVRDYSSLPLKPKAKPKPKLKESPVQDSLVVIEEPEFLAALSEAQAAGRTALTVPELERLLALPYPVNYHSQRGYAKQWR
jgi:hypothetical protein